MNNKEQSIIQARALLRSQELGVLSTHSKSMPGYPFGSVTTYVSTQNGEPIFYISDLAQHTKNILQNGKASFTVFSGDENDANAGSRLSVVGTASRVDDNLRTRIEQRFFAAYPTSRKYKEMHDFDFFILKCERVRYIGGFGEIYWFGQEDWLLETPAWQSSEDSMVEHMNEDHSDALQLIYQNHYETPADTIKMLAINPESFLVRANSFKPQVVPFEKVAATAQDVRAQLVKLTNKARASFEPDKMAG